MKITLEFDPKKFVLSREDIRSFFDTPPDATKVQAEVLADIRSLLAAGVLQPNRLTGAGVSKKHR